MPYWPICFCTRWPSAVFDCMRLPQAITCICDIATPASASAPRHASDARSVRSLSVCLPNLVMWMPSTQTESAGMSVLPAGWFEAEADGLGPLIIGPYRVDREPHGQADAHVLRVGGDVDEVGAHLGAAAVDHRGDKRNPDAGRRHVHD